MGQKEDIIEVYRDDKITSTFDLEREKYKYQKYKHKIESEVILESLPDKKELKILDVACGTGRMLPEILKKKGTKYFGIDTSESMMKHLTEKVRSLGVKKKVELKYGDATQIPYGNETFDITFSYHLLWHLPKEVQVKIINEMFRVTKKEGIVIFDVLNENFIWEKIKFIFGVKKIDGIYKLNIQDVKKIISNKHYKKFLLSDAHIKNSLLYGIFNMINLARSILPQFLYHMIYFRVRK